MGSKRGQKAKKRAKRESRRQTRRAQRCAEASSTPRASSTQVPTTAPAPPPPTTCPQPNATMIAPAYILKTREDCWNCYRETAVFALAAEGIERQTPSPSKLDRFVLMTSIEWLSPDLREILKQHSQSAFSLDESARDDGSRHYINHCSHCGAPFDNDELFESGEAFCPMYEDECEYTVIGVPDGVDLSISGTTAMPDRQSFLPHP